MSSVCIGIHLVFVNLDERISNEGRFPKLHFYIKQDDTYKLEILSSWWHGPSRV